MNYLKHYIRLCKRAKSRHLINEYSERHHVFPICMFGPNKYIVRLTAKEHFVAHYLLFKICLTRYGEDDIRTRKLGYAFYKMTISSPNQKRHTSRSFQVAKQWYSLNNPYIYHNRSGSANPMFGRTGEAHPRFGTTHSEETKQKISSANKGRLVGNRNPSKRIEVKQKISLAKKGVPLWMGRNNHPKTKITDDQKREILEEWEKVKGTISIYKFCRSINAKYGVSPSAISNLFYR